MSIACSGSVVVSTSTCSFRITRRTDCRMLASSSTNRTLGKLMLSPYSRGRVGSNVGGFLLMEGIQDEGASAHVTALTKDAKVDAIGLSEERAQPHRARLTLAQAGLHPLDDIGREKLGDRISEQAAAALGHDPADGLIGQHDRTIVANGQNGDGELVEDVLRKL